LRWTFGVIQSGLPQEAFFGLSDKMTPVEKPRKSAFYSASGLDVHRPNLYDYFELASGKCTA